MSISITACADSSVLFVLIQKGNNKHIKVRDTCKSFQLLRITAKLSYLSDVLLVACISPSKLPSSSISTYQIIDYVWKFRIFVYVNILTGTHCHNVDINKYPAIRSTAWWLVLGNTLKALHCILTVTIWITSSLKLIQVCSSQAAPWGFGGTVVAKLWQLHSWGRDLRVLLSWREMGHFASCVYKPHTAEIHSVCM